MGQVPNSGKDVGATAVLCEDDKGRTFVIALEPPHASEEDKKNVFLNPKVTRISILPLLQVRLYLMLQLTRMKTMIFGLKLKRSLRALM